MLRCLELENRFSFFHAIKLAHPHHCASDSYYIFVNTCIYFTNLQFFYSNEVFYLFLRD